MKTLIQIFILLLCQFIMIGCNSSQNKNEQFGTSKIILQVENKSDIPLLVNRLQTYSKISKNKVSSSVESNNLLIEIVDLLAEEKIKNLFKLNGLFKLKGNNDITFTEEKFNPSFDSFLEPSIVFVFDSIYKKELENFSKDNLKQKTEVFMGNIGIASPTFMNTINNGRLGLTLKGSNFDIYIVHAASKERYPHDIEFKYSNYEARFKDSIISDKLFEQYKSIQIYPGLGASLSSHRTKFAEKFGTNLGTLGRRELLQKMNAVIIMLRKVYTNDLLEFIKKSNFSNYTELESFITRLNSIQENHKRGISTTEEVIDHLYLIVN